MYIYWYNWYTILSNPHKHCVSERATFPKSLAHCATRLVHPPWLTIPNRTNLPSHIFHFSSLSCMYHFRHHPSGTLFCPFLPFFTLSARSILNKLIPTLAALADVFLPTCTAGPGTVIALSVFAGLWSLFFWWEPFWGKSGEIGIPRQKLVRSIPRPGTLTSVSLFSIGRSFGSVDVHLTRKKTGSC